MYPEIMLKITMSPEGVQVSNEQSSSTPEEFSVPILPEGQQKEMNKDYVIPSIPNEELDVIEDYSVPSLPTDDDTSATDEEFAVPVIPTSVEDNMEEEYSIPVPSVEELSDEIAAPILN